MKKSRPIAIMPKGLGKVYKGKMPKVIVFRIEPKRTNNHGG